MTDLATLLRQPYAGEDDLSDLPIEDISTLDPCDHALALDDIEELSAEMAFEEVEDERQGLHEMGFGDDMIDDILAGY